MTNSKKTNSDIKSQPKSPQKNSSKQNYVFNKENLKDFRMYRDEYPKIDDLVMAEVTRIEDAGIYLKLLEYQNLEGLMVLSEVSKRRWRTISKLVKVRRKEIVMVMRVDKEKNYVDLSKKRVPAAERAKFFEKFKNTSKFHSILKQVCARCDFSLEEVYKRFGWQLYEDFPHAINGLEMLNLTPKKFFEKYDVPPELKTALEENVQRRLTKKSRKIRAVVEINCFNSSGIESIRQAIKMGEKSVENGAVKIRLISSPRFSVTTQSKDPEKGTEDVVLACEAVEKEILRLKGSFCVVEAAKVEEDEAVDELSEDFEEFKTLK